MPIRTIGEAVLDFGNLGARAPVILRRIMDEEGRTAAASMRRHFVPYAGYPSARGPEQLNIRSGRLLGAIGHSVGQTANETELEAGVLTHEGRLQMIALVQEEGKTIVPRTAQKLAIPMAAATLADGQRRYRNVADARRDYPTLRTYPGVIKGYQPGDTTGTSLFLRRTSVQVGPHPFVAQELGPLVGRIAERVADAFVDELVGEGEG